MFYEYCLGLGPPAGGLIGHWLKPVGLAQLGDLVIGVSLNELEIRQLGPFSYLSTLFLFAHSCKKNTFC